MVKIFSHTAIQALISPLTKQAKLCTVIAISVSTAGVFAQDDRAKPSELEALRSSNYQYFAQQYEFERGVYQTALQELALNPSFNLTTAKKTLKDYPLLPFLNYSELRAQFADYPAEAIANFQEEHKGSYIERKLTSEWMSYLGQNEQWALFQQFNDSRFQNQSNRCYALNAKLNLPTAKENPLATQQTMHKLWMTGSSLPKACDPIIEHLESLQLISQNDIWQRFDLAYAQKNDRLANYLIKSMPLKNAEKAIKLLQADNNSDYWFAQLSTPTQPMSLSSRSYKRLLSTLAGVDNLGVAGLIENYRLPLTEKDWLSVKSLSAWYFAKFDASSALVWIDQQEEKNSFALQQKQLRYAMQAKNWAHYIISYEQTNDTLKQQSEWKYWYALALLESSSTKDMADKANEKNILSLSKKQQQQYKNNAEDILTQLAKQQDFYGLLAAKYFQQQLNIEENIDLDHWDIDEKTYQQLSAAIELYLLDEHLIASRQWYFSSKGFKRKQWRDASAIAHQLHWHERMLRAISSSGFGVSISEQYPIAFEKNYATQSQATGIDISWLLAMSRQESGFAPLAKSNKGALGVMQLMPNTARKLAEEIKVPYQQSKLLDPEYNIQLGSRYLQQLLERFNNNYVLATAAYNAGPHRVDEWLALRPLGDDWSHWIAAIPYRETRKYVQNILTYSHVYQQHLPDYLRSDLKLTLFQAQIDENI